MHNETEKKYKCNICAYSTKHNHSLSQHINAMHFQQKFPCNSCEFQATCRTNLSRHVKNVHRREDIVCISCNKTIKLSSVAKHKWLFHSGVQTQHKCDLCPYQTIHTGSLKRHKQNIHHKLSEN